VVYAVDGSNVRVPCIEIDGLGDLAL